MKKLVKKYLGVALVGLMLASVGAQFVSAAARNPRGSDGVGFYDPSFIGLKVGIVFATLSPTRIVTNDAGLLYAVCNQNQTAGTYAVAFDYTTGLSPLDAYIAIDPLNDEQTNNNELQITPYVYSSGAVTGYRAESQWGCFVPPWPVRFESGLVGINDNAAGYSLYYYRLDDGVNP